MTRQLREYHFRVAFLVVLLMSVYACWAQPQGMPSPSDARVDIPESKIAALEAELPKRDKRASSARQRRACKSLVRRAEGLLEAFPDAPNCYRVLGVMLKTQKLLLTLETSDRNRATLFDICTRLVEAPDEYAEIRLEAELLLSERDLAAKAATLQERAGTLAAIVERYRGTPAEAKCLMMAAMIAPKLDDADLERAIRKAMDDRFAGDLDVIEFRRRHLGANRLDVLFAGTYKRADGVELRFPADLMGRLSVMVFWSRKTPGFEQYLQGIKQQQILHPGRFEVFSFNLDELPDSGAGTLRALELDWTVMRLPGGKKSRVFGAYARRDPVGILVNSYGHTLLVPTILHAVDQAKLGVRGVPSPILTLSRRLDDARYLSQLQSLLIGDVLVTEPDGALDPALPPELKMLSITPGKGADAKLARSAGSVPAQTLRDIQECFAAPPFRYRLTTAEALANYRKGATLCRAALKQHSTAPDLWIVRNREIIALLGLWRLTGEPKYLESASQEARASLSEALPRGADVVPRFCLARDKIRLADTDPETILSGLIKESGGDSAPASAYAAAAILALDANARDLHMLYGGALLEAPNGGNPMLWSMVSFFRDRIYTYRLLKANYIQKERGSIRSYMINHGGETMTDLMPELTLKTLDGRTLNLPRDTKGRLTLLVFVELSADPDAEFPISAIGRGKEDGKKRSKNPHSMLRFACTLGESHIHKEVNVIAAFLSEDADHIRALMKEMALTCQATMVTGGLGNPLVRRLGILSADRIPNVFLVRRDGSIVWHASGLKYGDSSGFVALLALKVHIEVCELQTAYEALKNGDYEKAAKVFSGPYLPWNPDRFGWRSPRYHGKALACMALKDWDAALEAIDTAIDAHKLRHFLGRRRRWAKDWRMDVPQVVITKPCDILAELWNLKATILLRLGRTKEAAAIRKLASGPVTPDGASPYVRFHRKLKKFRLNQP